MSAEFEVIGALVPVLRNRKTHKLKGLRREDLERVLREPNAPKPVVVEGESIDVALAVGLDELRVRPGFGTCANEGCGMVYELVPPWPGAKRPKTCPACRIKVRVECAEKCGKPATHGPHCWEHRQTVCAGWEGECPEQREPGPNSFKGCKVVVRNGEPWRCRKCAANRMRSYQDPQKMALAARARMMSMSPSQRASMAKKAGQARRRLSPERATESAKKAWATRRSKAAGKSALSEDR